jgi:uncharacterized protein with HEPN domain
MIEAAETVLNFVSGRQRADLNSHQMLLFPLVRAIEVVRRGREQVSKATRGATADIPWSLAVSMRN